MTQPNQSREAAIRARLKPPPNPLRMLVSPLGWGAVAYCATAILGGIAALLAGILGMSGYLPLAGTLAAEASDANRSVPVFMAHGEADPVIPQTFSRQSADFLLAAGYPLAWRSYRMEHSLCMEELRDIESWLAGVLVA